MFGCRKPDGIDIDVLFVVLFWLSQTTVPSALFTLHVVDACVSGAPTAEKADVDSVGVVILSGYPDMKSIGVFTKAVVTA